MFNFFKWKTQSTWFQCTGFLFIDTLPVTYIFIIEHEPDYYYVTILQITRNNSNSFKLGCVMCVIVKSRLNITVLLLNCCLMSWVEEIAENTLNVLLCFMTRDVEMWKVRCVHKTRVYLFISQRIWGLYVSPVFLLSTRRGIRCCHTIEMYVYHRHKIKYHKFKAFRKLTQLQHTKILGYILEERFL